MTARALVWFRQDLRCSDNPALISACNQHSHVLPVYIFDEQTLPIGDAQKWWLHHSLYSLKKSLNAQGLTLILRRGDPSNILSQLINQHDISTVYWNRCYEPAAIERDRLIKQALKEKGIQVTSSNASLLNEPCEIKNKQGDYFKVFTPLWKACLARMQVRSEMPACPPVESIESNCELLDDWNLLPKKINWAAEFHHYWEPGEVGAHKKLNQFLDLVLNSYKGNRDLPALLATSRLSPHLHFGEISPWQIQRAVEYAKIDPTTNLDSAQHFMAEIGWREFSYHLLFHFPELSTANFKKEFDNYPWQHDEIKFTCWKRGQTGYPIVDAGMRELWKTGYMHNRARMIVASFLTKDLLIDWRHGAEWFWSTLLDADLANNSASWQWVAGSGADAAPYFRIFNPVLQSEKFDPDGTYIRRWVPELATVDKKWIHAPWQAPKDDLGIEIGNHYPNPIVAHHEARAAALKNYQHLRVIKG